MEKCEIDKVEALSLRFDSHYAAIEYYLTKAPTRQRPQSPEPVGGCKPSYGDFDPRHPNFLWAILSKGFSDVFRDLDPIETYAYRWLFKMYPPHWGAPEIAENHSVDKKFLFRAKKYVKEVIEDFLIAHQLMAEPKYYEKAKRDYHKYG